ncbi:apolipoprotein D-like [Limulus polyphemus]|uniref:Apolipoprotein D-like n=1 Tax=Limulus polyphemus TaxID=6850 RepID=A0ABM1SCR7_LIMPO|nr:apolipoprotein D-like [Limulus polyphemus]
MNGVRLVFVVFLYVSASLHIVCGRVFKLGSCPNVEVQENFNLNKFIGQWYVIQRFQSSSQCLTQNITVEDGDYYLSENGQLLSSDLLGINQVSTHEGKLLVPKKDSPSKMVVDFPLTFITKSFMTNISDPFGKVNYWVMMTDYDNYAAIWSCRRMLLGHLQNAEILSRSPTLDKLIINKIRGRFENYGIDEHNFSVIDQKDCRDKKKRNGVGISLFLDNIFGRLRI